MGLEEIGLAGTVHAFEFLKLASWTNSGPVVPVFGSDRFLSSLVTRQIAQLLLGEEASMDAKPVDGERVAWSDVYDELSTASLFSSAARVVIVRDADQFVKANRDRIEKIASQPAEDRCLVLCVSSWPANTKLFKLCDKHGQQIAVSSPVKPRGKSRDEKQVKEWIVAWARSEHGLDLSLDAAAAMLDLLDDNYGRIDCELAKLALVSPAGAGSKKISPEIVAEVVGGWRTQSIWQAVEHAVDGDLAQSWELLNQLLLAGEHPLSLFGQIAWSLRRYGAAFDHFMRARRQGESISTTAALKAAGFRAWGGELEEGERRMKKLGRKRLARINDWLLRTDLALKGTHSQDRRARSALEMLFARLAENQELVVAK